MPEERDLVALVVEGLRRTLGKFLSVELETVRWETHAWPDAGDDAQDVINREIGEFDVFVGIMWRRFGTATKRAPSGTAEEFERAYDFFTRFDRPKIMFYFCTRPFYSTDLVEIEQFGQVLGFRKKLQDYGVLFWEYDEPIEFERRFREHLSNQIGVLAGEEEEPASAPTIYLSYKHQDRDRVEPVYEALKAAGLRPWMDVKDMLPGTEWRPELERSIRAADFFLPFVSNHSVDKEARSATGFSVTSEIDVALQRDQIGPNDSGSGLGDAYLIPVRLDPVTPPPDIAEFQWIDLFETGGVESLVETVRRVWASRGQ